MNADGSIDPSFDPGKGITSGMHAGIIQPDGKILAGGTFYLYTSSKLTLFKTTIFILC